MASTGVTRILGVDPSVAIKAPCKVATTANITLSGAQTTDGVAVAETTPATRVLVWMQTDGVENGVYDVKGTAWTRSEDFDGARDVVQGTVINVTGGSTYAEVAFKVTTADPITIGTTAIVFNTTMASSSSNFDVANYSVLQGLDTTLLSNNQSVNVRQRAQEGDLGGGVVHWSTSDLNVEVTADPEKGIYMPPTSDTSGVSGSFVRGDLAIISGNWYGMIPDGDGAGGGTENSTATQAFFNYMILNGGKGEVARGTYRVDSKITLIRTGTSFSDNLFLDFNGAAIDMSATAETSGGMFRAGADDLASVNEGGRWGINNLFMIGPETDNVSSTGSNPVVFTTPTPDSSTQGLRLEFMVKFEMRNVFIYRFYIGLAQNFGWTQSLYNCDIRSCYIGQFIETDVTQGNYFNLNVNNAYFAVVAQPDSDDESLEGHTWHEARIETCLQVAVYDPRNSATAANGVRWMTWVNGRYERIKYDYFQVGTAWTFNSTGAIGADRTARVTGVTWDGGNWSQPEATSGTPKYIRFNTTTDKVRELYINSAIGDIDNIAGAYTTGNQIFIRGTYGNGDDAYDDTSAGEMRCGSTLTASQIRAATGYSKFSSSGSFLSGAGSFFEISQDANDYLLRMDQSHATQTETAVRVTCARDTSNGTYNFMDFLRNGVSVFEVEDSGDVANTNGTYGTLSDVKLKTNVKDADLKATLEKFKRYRFVKYNLKEDVERLGGDALCLLGTIAQEVEEISPGLVAERDDTKEVYEEVDGEMVPKNVPNGETTKYVKTSIMHTESMLVVQELINRVESSELVIDKLLKRIETLEKK